MSWKKFSYTLCPKFLTPSTIALALVGVMYFVSHLLLRQFGARGSLWSLEKLWPNLESIRVGRGVLFSAASRLLGSCGYHSRWDWWGPTAMGVCSLYNPLLLWARGREK